MTTDPKALADQIEFGTPTWTVFVTREDLTIILAALRAPSSAETMRERAEGKNWKLGAALSGPLHSLEERLDALSPDPGSAPVEGWREGAEAMRQAAYQAALTEETWRPYWDGQPIAFAVAGAIRDLPLPPPPADLSRDAPEGERR